MDKLEIENRKKLAEALNMPFAGLNEDGEPEFIGSDKQWREFESLIDEINVTN